jgi:hypothetical protein
MYRIDKKVMHTCTWSPGFNPQSGVPQDWKSDSVCDVIQLKSWNMVTNYNDCSVGTHDAEMNAYVRPRSYACMHIESALQSGSRVTLDTE